LPSRAIGFVREGQEVYLRLDAFSYRRYGFARGRVRQIAGVAVAPADLGIALAVHEDVYPVRVRLERQDFDARGQRRPLSAGMRLEAEIVIDRPRLLDAVLAPLAELASAAS